MRTSFIAALDLALESAASVSVLELVPEWEVAASVSELALG
jgi:hypothetical protein